MLPKDSKGLSKDVVGRISAYLRKIGCRCVLDESQKAWEPAGVQVNIVCRNRFSSLVDEDEYVGGEPNVDVVRRKLFIGYWDFWRGYCNRSGNKYFLNELELVICNGRQCVSEPELTRVRPSLDQNSIL